MSQEIAALAVTGARQVVAWAERAFASAIAEYGSEAKVSFPNTGYFLPVIYGVTGLKVARLEDIAEVLTHIRTLMPPENAGSADLPQALDAGMAALFAAEVIEAIRYLRQPQFYGAPAPRADVVWLGAADDTILRKRGIQFVDGTAPGFAVCVGAAPDATTAAALARELQENHLYVFMAGTSRGTSMAEQLAVRGVETGWETRLVPCGRDITAVVFAMGFAVRVALSFGALVPGDRERLVPYMRERVQAFVLALGEINPEKCAFAVGALNFGFPVVAEKHLPEIGDIGLCKYECLVGGVPYEQMVKRALEVRGLKIKIARPPIPVAFGPAFEGETLRKPATFVEFGGQHTPAFELVRTLTRDEVADGRITVAGPDVDAVPEGGRLPLGIVVDIYGRRMHPDFEPVLERRLHHYINYAEGVWHIGQRDLIWVRISKEAFAKGFRLRHLGDILCAMLKDEFGGIIDRVQVALYTRKEEVLKLREEARAYYARRDARLENLRDESVDTFYACTLCQTFAPSHVCVVLPERVGLCGAVSWLDARAAYEINPHGCNRPVPRSGLIDPVKGEWAACNTFIREQSHGAVERVCFYSIMDAPHTSCGCFEAIVSILPECNGFLVVNREYSGMTPSGMTFSTLAGSIGGGVQTPGFMGIARSYLASRKFIRAEGGLARVVWMPRSLKEQMRPALLRAAAAAALPEGFIDMVADEEVGVTVDAILPFLEEKGHPALRLDPLF